MIRVFKSTDKDFTSNGDVVITPLRANVHKEDNGEYYLELDCSHDYSEYLKAGNIVVAPTPTGDQAFRIEAPVENTRTKVRLKMYHVYYDSENYLIADSYVDNRTCNYALAHLNQATDNPSPFTTYSDVAGLNSFRCVRKSLNEAVSTVLERWGGHLVRDNFSIEIRNSIGRDNGVVIQYRKNLKEIIVTEDWSSVCTKLLPVGADGYTIPGLYLYAETRYPIPFTKTVDFDQSNIVREDYPTEEAYYAALKADLIEKGTQYLKASQYPSINYTLSANVDKITDVGDIVKVYDERLGVDITAAVLSYDYDCILGKYTSVEFGSVAPSLGNLLNSVSSEVNSSLSQYTADITAYLSQAVSIAVAQIWETLGSSYVVYNGDEIIVLDSLPAENATNVMKITNNGISVSFTGVHGEFKTVWSLNGSLDLSVLDNVHLGESSVGGNSNSRGRIRLFNSSNVAAGTIDRNGIDITSPSGLMVASVNILSHVVFKAGDTYSATNRVECGYIGSGSDSFTFTVALGKLLDQISSVSVTALKLNVRTSSGSFIFGSYTSGGYNVLTDSSLSVSTVKGEDYITFTVTKSSAWSVTANSIVSVSIESLGLSFS
jgi:phage minor structural protein